MIDEVQGLLDQYVAWLKDKTVLRQVKDWVEITTPYMDRHNDYLQFYAKRENGGFLLTDDGYIIEDLKRSGCELDTKKRKDLLTLTLNGFGVKVDGDALVVHASMDNFALRKHNMIQAMLAVNDLFYLAAPVVSSLFLEDVAAWLDLNDIRYTPRVKFAGKSGYDHLFDFVIPASKKQPERILRAINHPNRDAAEAVVLACIDTKEVRPPNSRAYTLLNDVEHAPSISVLDALRNYNVRPVPWSKREDVREELAA
ncbi:MAG: hypothetical protein A3J24_03770 [Deltaproteobacteria bacterium RIFCSPLOWO2_02_FULL_53_8]|nr:MAG: hypothetical protein A3J24_03770 [Deltaproteobacteria bacterium RIFCSPLOWO2_02_FULL_53_8]